MDVQNIMPTLPGFQQSYHGETPAFSIDDFEGKTKTVRSVKLYIFKFANSHMFVLPFNVVRTCSALGSSNPSTATTTTSSSAVVGERKLFSSVTRLGFAAGHDSPSFKNDQNNPNSRNDTQTRIESSGATGQLV